MYLHIYKLIRTYVEQDNGRRLSRNVQEFFELLKLYFDNSIHIGNHLNTSMEKCWSEMTLYCLLFMKNYEAWSHINRETPPSKDAEFIL